MDPEHMEWMSREVQNGRFLYCPNGSHIVQYDDQKVYFLGLVKFICDVDIGKLKRAILNSHEQEKLNISVKFRILLYTILRNTPILLLKNYTLTTFTIQGTYNVYE